MHISQRFPKVFHKISPRFPLDFRNIVPRCPQNFPKTSPKFPQDFPQISPRFQLEFSKISTRFPQDFPKISQRFLSWSVLVGPGLSWSVLVCPGMSWSLLIRQAQEKNGKGPGIEVLNLLYSRKVARCNFATLSIITLILRLIFCQLYNNLLPAL